MIKISVSVLDAFNKYIKEHSKRSGDLIYPDAQSFIDYLKRDYVSTADMEYGSAVDAIIEYPEKYWSIEHKEYIYKGIAIPQKYIERITPFFDYNFPFQVDGSEMFRIGDVDVQLRARADQLHGLDTVEFKTTWSSYSYERFANSMQWKCYNVIFGTNRVRYVIAESSRKAGGEISLKKIHQFYLYHTQENLLEISKLLSELVDFLEINNLIEEMEVVA